MEGAGPSHQRPGNHGNEDERRLAKGYCRDLSNGRPQSGLYVVGKTKKLFRELARQEETLFLRVYFGRCVYLC